MVSVVISRWVTAKAVASAVKSRPTASVSHGCRALFSTKPVIMDGIAQDVFGLGLQVFRQDFPKSCFGSKSEGKPWSAPTDAETVGSL